MLGREMVNRWFVMAAVVVISLSCSSARAEIIYSGTTDGPWQLGAANDQLAQTFTTGSAPMTLSSVGVWVRNADSVNEFSAEGLLTLSLFNTDGSSKPTGSALLTIVNGASVGEFGDGWIEDTTLNYPLAANTTYAVVFAATAESTISWKYNDSTAIASSISPTPTFYSWQSTDNGGTWSNASPTTGFNMVVTAVPEPATMTALGTAGAIAGFVRLRRRKRA